MRLPRASAAMNAIVDDDLSAREGLDSLVRSAGWRAETFGSAQEFLARAGAEAPGCLILDLQLPGLSGLDLQRQMAEIQLEIRTPPSARKSCRPCRKPSITTLSKVGRLWCPN